MTGPSKVWIKRRSDIRRYDSRPWLTGAAVVSVCLFPLWVLTFFTGILYDMTFGLDLWGWYMPFLVLGYFFLILAPPVCAAVCFWGWLAGLDCPRLQRLAKWWACGWVLFPSVCLWLVERVLY